MLENIINQDGAKHQRLGPSSGQLSPIQQEWVLLILFSFISTFLLEVFGLTRFQRALAELYVPCHY